MTVLGTIASLAFVLGVSICGIVLFGSVAFGILHGMR